MLAEPTPQTTPRGDALASALGKLYARANMGVRLGLDSMRSACVRAGHPERAFDVVHIAGTNGKGSTSAMVEAIARASGLRTGLYTSPHLCRFAERIRIDGEPIADDALSGALAYALAIGPELSFFETATLAAFHAFREHGVALAVVEVGLGGRFDATNIVETPRVCAITRIAFDHMDRLGDTLEAIAREKAGIAKRAAPLVVGPVTETVREVIDDAALAVGTHVVSASGELPPDAKLPPGRYQQANARVAWTIADLLGFDEATRLRGLAAARWPGRFEHVDTAEGPYLLDGAHNPDGAAALRGSLGSSDGHPSGQALARRVLVFGAMADKSWPEVQDLLAPSFDARVYVEPEGRAPATTSALAERHEGSSAATVAEGLARARTLAGPSGLVVVTGSLYLVGQARALLLGLRTDPPIAL